MGFSEEFVNNIAEEVTSRTMQADYDFIEKILKQAVANASIRTPYFDPNDVALLFMLFEPPLFQNGLP